MLYLSDPLVDWLIKVISKSYQFVSCITAICKALEECAEASFLFSNYYIPFPTLILFGYWLNYFVTESWWVCKLWCHWTCCYSWIWEKGSGRVSLSISNLSFLLARQRYSFSLSWYELFREQGPSQFLINSTGFWNWWRCWVAICRFWSRSFCCEGWCFSDPRNGGQDFEWKCSISAWHV